MSAETLPRWDLTPFFPSVESEELSGALEQMRADTTELTERFDELGIDAGASVDDAPGVFEELLGRLNELYDRVHLLGAYLTSVVAADSRDEAAQGRLSEFRRETVPLSNLETRFTAWVGSLDAEGLLAESDMAREHEYAVRRSQVAAQHLMTRPEEELAAELELTGATAWSKLRSDLSSQILVRLVLDGEEKELPITEVVNLSHHPDRDVRRTAHEAELRAWEAASVPLAAALNSIKGEVNALAARRGWDSALDEALFANSLDRETLDALLEAVREALPDLRRYLYAKARALGLDRTAWYDLDAPIGSGENGAREWPYEDARTFIVEQFGTYSDRMRDFAERAFAESWIDAGPRAGKTGGAFCILLRGNESRILANYVPAYSGLSTLAHELGHGYHNLAKAHRTPIQRRTPMSLAETASIFCETIVREAALAEAAPAEQLEILEGSLQSAFAVTVDILSRFLFESSVFDRRHDREQSVAELCELMLDAQRQTYGDAVEPDTFHQYMWAAKPHYYFAGRSFYNYPYTFGLLFGLGLYARYEDDPDEFRAGYDDLLSSTGLADAATLAGRFGIDVRAPEFWRSSLDVVRADVERFEQLVAGA